MGKEILDDVCLRVLIFTLDTALWCNYLPGSSVHGVLQARVLEEVAMPSSRGSSQSRNPAWVSCIAGKFFTAEPAGKP